MTIEHITDHAERAAALILSQFADSARIHALVELCCGEVQALEDLLNDLITERTVDTAVGVQLDAWGVIVGQPRGGLVDDDDYRRVIKVRLVANRSDGQAKNIVWCASELMGVPVWYRQRGTAHYSLQWIVADDTPDAWLDQVNEIIALITPAAVSYEATEGVTGAFQLDVEGVGLDEGLLGRSVA